MIRRRQFTAAFTAQIVLERLSGAKSRVELCREHQMAASVLAEWKACFLSRAAAAFGSPEPSQDREAVRVAE